MNTTAKDYIDAFNIFLNSKNRVEVNLDFMDKSFKLYNGDNCISVCLSDDKIHLYFWYHTFPFSDNIRIFHSDLYDKEEAYKIIDTFIALDKNPFNTVFDCLWNYKEVSEELKIFVPIVNYDIRLEGRMYEDK